MERRGVYRKGSAGHVRNVNIYRLYMQKAKRWRAPIALFLALTVVFSAAPTVGDEFQASLLSVDEQAKVQTSQPEDVKKVLLDAVKSFTDECDRFKINDCVAEGKSLMNEIALAGQDVLKYVLRAEDFSGKYEKTVALYACKYDLGNAFVQVKNTQDSLNTFFEQYGDVLGEFGPDFSRVDLNRDGLQRLVDFCSTELLK